MTILNRAPITAAARTVRARTLSCASSHVHVLLLRVRAMSLTGNPEWTRFEETRRIAWASMLGAVLATLVSAAFNRVDVNHARDPDLDKYGNGAAFYLIGNLGIGVMFVACISGSLRTMTTAVVTMLVGLISCAFGIVHEIKQPGQWVDFNMAYWITDLIYTGLLGVNFGVASALAAHLTAARLVVIQEAMNKDASKLTPVDHAAVGSLDLSLNPNDYDAGSSPFWLLGSGANNSRDLLAGNLVALLALLACATIYYFGFLAVSWNTGLDGQAVVLAPGITSRLVDVAPNYAAAVISFGIPSLFVGAQAGLLISPSIRAQVPALILGVPALGAAVVGNVYDRAFTDSVFVKTMTIIQTVLLGLLAAVVVVRMAKGATSRLRRPVKR